MRNAVPTCNCGFGGVQAEERGESAYFGKNGNCKWNPLLCRFPLATILLLSGMDVLWPSSLQETTQSPTAIPTSKSSESINDVVDKVQIWEFSQRKY
jgi:hypothetical protein